jgi:hypothetical protein
VCHLYRKFYCTQDSYITDDHAIFIVPADLEALTIGGQFLAGSVYMYDSTRGESPA